MKKTIAMLLALCMLFALAGCSLDSIVNTAENLVVENFGVDASGNKAANVAAFAANSGLVLLDALSAAEEMRGFVSCAQGYLSAAEALEETTSPADTLELIKAAYDANEGRSYDTLEKSFTSASIGLENLKLTLPAGSSACDEILAKLDTLVSLLGKVNTLISSPTEESLQSASDLLTQFSSAAKGIDELIDSHRLIVTDNG